MNQYKSPKHWILWLLWRTRQYLRDGHIDAAQTMLAHARRVMAAAPASTRRRWKAGR